MDDIDIFAAGISEKPQSGAQVGPTFACLIGEQFQKYRDGDRFWHENPGPQGFTEGKLKNKSCQYIIIKQYIVEYDLNVAYSLFFRSAG